MNRGQKGAWGEKIIALWLQLHGWKILHKNYQSSLGEIDLIAKRKNMLCAFEIKWRKHHDADPVTFVQKQRIKRSFEAYIARNPSIAKTYRIDLIIYHPPFYIKHIPNAWH
ncbi:MAG: YraN family protein [Alphaproteobacteria bacterium]